MFQGCGATITRAMVVNAAQLASYSQAKQLVMSTGEAPYCQTVIVRLMIMINYQQNRHELNDDERIIK